MSADGELSEILYDDSWPEAIALEYNATLGMVLPPTNSCTWTVEANTLPAGEYAFIVNGSLRADWAEDSVRVKSLEVVAGVQLHSIAIEPLTRDKVNPGSRLALHGLLTPGVPFNVSLEDGDGVWANYTVSPTLEHMQFEWKMVPVLGRWFNLSDPSLSSYGNDLPSFYLLGGTLNPGSTYTFELHATIAVQAPNSTDHFRFSTFASIDVLVNRPPYGGDFLLTTADKVIDSSTVLVALETPVTLECREWTDDPGDMPLEYSFLRVSEGGSTYLGKRSQSKATTWLYPTSGTWLLVANVYDTYGAVTMLENPAGNVFVQAPAVVNAAALAPILSEGKQYVAVGDAAGATQMVAAAAETLNNGGVAEQNIDLRASLVGLLCDTSDAAGSDPEQTAARAAALAAATESPQMNLALLNGAECAVQAMVQNALATGFQPFEESGGARLGAEMIISSVSSLLQGADLLATGSSIGGTKTAAEKQAANDKINFFTSALRSVSRAMANDLQPGDREEYVAEGLSLGVQREGNLCDAEGVGLGATPLAGSTSKPSVTLPMGSLCPPPDDDDAERRRLGETTTIGTGIVQACAGGSISQVTYRHDPFAAQSPSKSLGTDVLSFRVDDSCGKQALNLHNLPVDLPHGPSTISSDLPHYLSSDTARNLPSSRCRWRGPANGCISCCRTSRGPPQTRND